MLFCPLGLPAGVVTAYNFSSIVYPGQLGKRPEQVEYYPSSHPALVAPVLLAVKCSFSFNLVCTNICERLDAEATVGGKNYKDGKKYCRRCEIYLFHSGNFCPCCGMCLRLSPTSRKQKERLRISQLGGIKPGIALSI